jgi:hypothetical protein
MPRPENLASTMSRIGRELRSRGSYVRSHCGRRAIALSGAMSSHAIGARLCQGEIVYTANKGFGAKRETRSS